MEGIDSCDDRWLVCSLAVVAMMVPDGISTVESTAAGASSAVERTRRDVRNVLGEQ